MNKTTIRYNSKRRILLTNKRHSFVRKHAGNRNPVKENNNKNQIEIENHVHFTSHDDC